MDVAQIRRREEVSSLPGSFEERPHMNPTRLGSIALPHYLNNGVPKVPPYGCSYLVITPEVARNWLEVCNRKNRPLSPVYRDKLARHLKAGDWKLNGMPIVFSRHGILLDGQHRLSACAAANIPIEAFVLYGLEPEVMDTIDINKARTAGDIAHLHDIPNANATCALAALLWIYQVHGIQYMSNGACKPTRKDILDLVQRDARIQEVASRVASWGRRFVPGRILALCYYLFSAQDSELCTRFFKEFTDGENLSNDNPVYLLRERMMRNASSNTRLLLIDLVALMFKTWIHYRDNIPLRVLRWRTDGPKPEGFPDIAVSEPEDPEESYNRISSW
jgi:hypothetical protein